MTQSPNRTAMHSDSAANSLSASLNTGWIAFAAISGGVSVIAGAFAAHGMDAVTNAREIDWLHLGSLYEALHALAMLAVAGLSGLQLVASKPAIVAQWSFTVGGIVFPAALYGLALGGPRWLGAIAPVGGSAFIVGWTALAIGALRRPKS